MKLIDNISIFPEYSSDKTIDVFTEIMSREGALFLNRIGGCDYDAACEYYNNKELINSPIWCKNKMNYIGTTAGYFDFSKSTQRFRDYLEFLITCYKENSDCTFGGSRLIDQFTANEFNNKDKIFLDYILDNKIAIHYSFIETVQPFLKSFHKWGLNKKILIISPLSKSVEHQFKNRTNLYIDNATKFPEFELKTYKTKITYNENMDTKGSLGIATDNWFDEAQRMSDEISNIDFDIAFLSCGSYAPFFGNYIKNKMGKKSVYLGGVLNVFFNIYGGRFKEGFYNMCKLNPDTRIDAFENDEISNIIGGRSGGPSESLNAYFGRR